MVGRYSPHGSDEMVVPAYLGTGDAAALERWKREHPDWFEAGRWTPGPGRARSDGSAIGDRAGSAAVPPRPGGSAAWDGGVTGSLDPANLSLGDFYRVKAAAHAAFPGPSLLVPVQAGPSRPPTARGNGGYRTKAEMNRLLRYEDALARIQRLQPRNQRSFVWGLPDSDPTEETVQSLEREAAALQALRAPAGPGEPDPATPRQRQDLGEVMAKSGQIRRDDPNEAHHIVPGGGEMSGGRDPAPAQAILRRFDIDLDSALNGVALSRAFHRRLHTRSYYDYVEQGLEAARSRQDAIVFLRQLARRLELEDAAYQENDTNPVWRK